VYASAPRSRNNPNSNPFTGGPRFGAGLERATDELDGLNFKELLAGSITVKGNC
jgi:hypothetical protein